MEKIHKMLALQYDFKVAIPLSQAIADYYNPLMTKAEINRKASLADFPFPVYKADPENRKSAWFVAVEDLGKWLNEQQEISRQDWRAMN